MIYVEICLYIPTHNSTLASRNSAPSYQSFTLEIAYNEDTGDEYSTAIAAVRASLMLWARHGAPLSNGGQVCTQPHFEITRVHDEWGDFALPIVPCIRCGEAEIEYREAEDICAYCHHITAKD